MCRNLISSVIEETYLSISEFRLSLPLVALNDKKIVVVVSRNSKKLLKRNTSFHRIACNMQGHGGGVGDVERDKK